MKENRTMDQIHRGLQKKYHSLCAVLGMTAEERKALLSAYGVESSCDLDQHQLIDLCAKLSEEAEKREGKKSVYVLRRRVMASIGQWLRLTGKEGSVSLIKGIACRATGYSDYNRIPVERLRNLIYLFNNKAKDAGSVAQVEEAERLRMEIGGATPRGEA